MRYQFPVTWRRTKAFGSDVVIVTILRTYPVAAPVVFVMTELAWGVQLVRLVLSSATILRAESFRISKV